MARGGAVRGRERRAPHSGTVASGSRADGQHRGGIFVVGDERTPLVESLVERGRGRIPIIAGTAAEWTDEAVRCIKESSGDVSRVRDIAPA